MAPRDVVHTTAAARAFFDETPARADAVDAASESAHAPDDEHDLVVHFVYTPNIAPAPAERAAFLTFFLSRGVRATPYARYDTSSDDEAASVGGTVVLPMRATSALPRDTTLTACAYVRTQNSHGEETLNQAGFARFYLDDLVRAGTARTSRPMLVAVANNYNKGAIELSVRVPSGARVTFAAPGAYDYDERRPEQMARFRAAVDAHIAASRRIYSALPLARGLETMASIRAPYYRAYGLEMPGVFFALVRPDAPTPAAWFENVLDIVLRRHWPHRELADARDHLADASARGASWYDAAVVLAKMLCVFVNYCTYLTDKIVEGHRHGLASFVERTRDRFIESFDVTFRDTLTSDCEDDTLASALEALDLAALGRVTPALERVKRARAEMECEMVLKGVLGGALSDAMARGRTVQFGGHMNARLTPRPLFLRRFARTAESGQQPFRDDPYVAAEFAGALPILDLEGTGVLDPDCARDATGPLHDYLSDGAPEAAFYRIKFSVQMPRDREHAFYKYCQSSMLPDRAELNYAMLETFYVEQASGQARAAAVAFPDSRCTTRENVSLWAGAELSDELLRWAPSVLKHVHPVPPHSLPATRAQDALAAARPRPELAALAQIGADAPVQARWLAMDYQLRDEQVTAARCRMLGDVLRRKSGAGGAVRRVDVHCEPVTATLRGWLVRVWLDPDALRARGVRVG